MSKSFINCSVKLVNSSDVSSKKLDAIVQLHKAAFPGFFLTILGTQFLGLLYRGFLDSDSGICIVAENDNGLIGFVAGTTEPDCFFRTLLKKSGVRFVLAAIPGLLHNPVIIVRKSFGALFYRGEKPEAMSKAALLSSLAVMPKAAGKGVGHELVKAFSDELSRRGLKAVYLTTDASDNDSVNRFYEKCGFCLLDTIERSGNRRMNRWTMDLANSA